MPSEKEHLIQYEKNKRFYKSIEDNIDNNEWVITAIFYTSLHLVDKMLSVVNDREKVIIPGRIDNPKTHLERDNSLKLFNEFTKDDEKLLASYTYLKSLSIRARYDCRPFVDPKKIIKNAKINLSNIEKVALNY